MRVLVTGVPGLLSADLIPILRTRHEVVPCSLPDLDITDREAVLKIHAAYLAPIWLSTAPGIPTWMGRKPISKRPGGSTPWG